MTSDAKVHSLLDSHDAGVRKKRRMTVVTTTTTPSSASSPTDLLSPFSSPTAVSMASLPLSPSLRRLSYQDSARESARRRWRLLQKHVCIMQWLSKDLMRRQLKRFALAQESLVDVLVTSKDDYMEVLVKIREHFLSLLDAENCVLSFEANRSVLEFDGRSIYPSTRAKRGGLLRSAMQSGHPVHLVHPSAPLAQLVEGGGLPHQIGTGLDLLRSYVCIPLVDSVGAVQAVAEVFNSRHDAKTVAAWLHASGSLHVLRNFVGNLIKAFTKRANLADLVGDGTARRSDSSIATTAATTATSDATTTEATASEINEYPLESLVEYLRQSVGIECCSVYALDMDADLLWARHADAGGCPQTVKTDDGIIGRAASRGETVRYSSSHTHAAEFEELFGSMQLPRGRVHDALCVPTFSGAQKLNGVVLLLNKKDASAFTAADLALCTSLCRHIGLALHSSELHEAIHRAQGKAQTLLDLSSVLFRELETNALLLAIMDAIKKPMNASKCCVFLLDDDRHELVAPVGSEISHDTLQTEFRTPVSAGIVGAAAREGCVINVRDAGRDPRFNASVDQLTGFVTRSILAVPIKDASGEVLGVLEMVNKQCKQYFDRDDEELARGIAYYLAIALKNAKLFDAARSARRRSDALLAMMQVISSSSEHVGDVFTALVDTACEILNVQHGALFFVDALSKSLFCRVGSNWKGYSVPLGRASIPGIVAERGEAVVLPRDARSHPEFDPMYDELAGVVTKSLLCVPIIKGGSNRSVVGVFYAVNKLTATFGDEDVKIMAAVANELAAIMERRAWELVFLMDAGSDDSGDSTTSSFLAQYTTSSSVPSASSSSSAMPRRRSSSSCSSTVLNSRAPTPSSLTGGGGGGGGGAEGEQVHRPIALRTQPAPAIRDWDLNPWTHTAPQLVDLVLEIFGYFDLPTRFHIDRPTLRRFVVSVKGQYHDIPYHNFYHAFSTLHVSFQIVASQPSVLPLTAAKYRPSVVVPSSPRIEEGGASESPSSSCSSPPPLLEPRDLLAIFVAALCHDMNHNGRTNDFHIRYKTSLAMLYNDQSVLENMHAAACFETLRRPGHNLLENVSAVEYRQLRKAIIRAILATDMHNHAAIVGQLHDKLKVDVFHAEDDAHKELLLNAIVHAADISGPAMTEKIHVQWSLQLLDEFNTQYKDEVALGLVPTPYMNAQPQSPELGKLNLAFIDSCVFPLWSILHTFLHGLDLCMDNLQRNRHVWIDMINATQQAPAPDL